MLLQTRKGNVLFILTVEVKLSLADLLFFSQIYDYVLID